MVSGAYGVGRDCGRVCLSLIPAEASHGSHWECVGGHGPATVALRAGARLSGSGQADSSGGTGIIVDGRCAMEEESEARNDRTRSGG